MAQRGHGLIELERGQLRPQPVARRPVVLGAEFAGQAPATEGLPAVAGQPLVQQPGQAAERVVGVIGGVGHGQGPGQVLESARIHQEPALPLQGVHLGMITQYPAQLACSAAASTPYEERPVHLLNVPPARSGGNPISRAGCPLHAGCRVVSRLAVRAATRTGIGGKDGICGGPGQRR